MCWNFYHKLRSQIWRIAFVKGEEIFDSLHFWQNGSGVFVAKRLFLASTQVARKFLEGSLRPVVYEAGCRGWKTTPNNFDLMKIREKSVKIWAKCVKTFANRFMPFGFTKMAPEIKVQTFLFLEVMFFQFVFGQVKGNLSKFEGNLSRNGAWSALIWKNAPEKWNDIQSFFEVIFFGVFSGKFGQNPSHPQNFACSYTYV